MARNKESMNIPLKASQWSDVCSLLPISQHPTPVSDKKEMCGTLKFTPLFLILYLTSTWQNITLPTYLIS